MTDDLIKELSSKAIELMVKWEKSNQNKKHLFLNILQQASQMRLRLEMQDIAKKLLVQ
jgi:hypothetical protein